MMKKLFPMLLMLMLCMGLAMTANAEITLTAPTAGDGSNGNPYQISTVGELYWFANHVNTRETSACAILMNSITVNEAVFNDDGSVKDGLETWTPIGSSVHYRGSFDGGGHTISGLYAKGDSTQGFLSQILRGTVQNLTIADSYFEVAYGTVGAIAGYNNRGTIFNCHSRNCVITGDCWTGGIVGKCSAASIEQCSSNSQVTAEIEYAGGIAGYVDGYRSSFSDCYNTGSLKGVNYVGGIVGCIEDGGNEQSSVKNCYNAGAITASGGQYYDQHYRGGIVGDAYPAADVVCCYYLDSSCESGKGKNDAGTALTAAQMVSDSNWKTNYYGFDTTYVWSKEENTASAYYLPKLKSSGVETLEAAKRTITTWAVHGADKLDSSVASVKAVNENGSDISAAVLPGEKVCLAWTPSGEYGDDEYGLFIGENGPAITIAYETVTGTVTMTLQSETDESGTKYYFIMPDADVTITGTFQKYYGKLWIGGVRVSDMLCSAQDASGSGWSYDAAGNILTLKNNSVWGVDPAEVSAPAGSGICYYGSYATDSNGSYTEQLTIRVQGDNHVAPYISTSVSPVAVAVYGADLLIQGENKDTDVLNIAFTAANYTDSDSGARQESCYGILTTGELKMEGCAVNPNVSFSGAMTYAAGLYSDAGITITNAKVNSQLNYDAAGSTFGVGAAIYSSSGSVSITDGSKVVAYTGDSTNDSCGIYAGGARGGITIIDSEVAAFAGKGVNSSGLAAGEAGVIIRDEDAENTTSVVAEGGEATAGCSWGISSGGDVIVAGGAVITEGGSASGPANTSDSCGIGALGKVTINGGDISARGGDSANGNSRGISAMEDIVIHQQGSDDSTDVMSVIAIGGKAEKGVNCGIYTNASFTLQDTDGSVTANGANYGIAAAENVTITDAGIDNEMMLIAGATLTASGKAVSAQGSITSPGVGYVYTIMDRDQQYQIKTTITDAEWQNPQVWMEPRSTYVYFELGGGTVADNSADSVIRRAGLPIVQPTDPVREHYDFAGWEDSDGNAIDFSTFVVPSDYVVIYAAWNPKEYTITADETMENGTLLSDDQQLPAQVAYDDWVQLIPLANWGYCYVPGSIRVTDATGAEVAMDAENVFCMPGSNVTVYAEFELAEAVWGASESSLYGAGTLRDALYAAEQAPSVAYIKLLSDVDIGASGFVAAGGMFTLDLNGHTISSDDCTLDIRNEGTRVQISDTSTGGTGRIVTSATNSAAVYLHSGGWMQLSGGTLEATDKPLMIMSDSTAFLENGTVRSGNTGVYVGPGGELKLTDATIHADGTHIRVDGSMGASGSPVFTGDAAVNLQCMDDARLILLNAPVDGWTLLYGLSEDGEGCIYLPDNYYGERDNQLLRVDEFTYGTYTLTKGYILTLTDGVEDEEVFADYAMPAKSGSNPLLTEEVPKNREGYAFAGWMNAAGVLVNNDLFNMPAENITMTAAWVLAEAVWGTDADNLNYAGTLKDAIAAAEQDSTVKYIKLLMDTDDYNKYIAGGSFTLDLNGYTLSGDGYVLDVRNQGTLVKVVDNSTAGTGKIVCSGSNMPAVYAVKGAEVTLNGITVESTSGGILIREGAHAVMIDTTVHAEEDALRVLADSSGDIYGGVFAAEFYCIYASGKITFHSRPEISSGELPDLICDEGGLLDLSAISADGWKLMRIDLEGTGEVILPENCYGEKDGMFCTADEFILDAEYMLTTAYTLTLTDGVENEEVFADRTQLVAVGNALENEFVPEREGYVFSGWDKAVPETMPAENVTLTATWVKRNKVAITNTYLMNVDGTYPDAPSRSTISELIDGANAVFSVPEGFTLDREKSDTEGTKNADGAIVYTIFYARNQYSIITNVDGTESRTTYYYEAPVTIETPEREGYVFSGWDKAVPETMPAENVTLTGCFIPETAETYAATVVNGTGSGNYAEGAYVTITADAPAAGYRFREWNGADGLTFVSGSASTGSGIIRMPAHDVTVTAVYELIPVIPSVEITAPEKAQSIIVTEGEQATMTVTAENAVSYQWYVNYNDGTGWHKRGENKPGYTTSVVKLSDNGYRYKCVVTGGDGNTAESPVFTLEVLAKVEIPETGDGARIGLWLTLCCLSGAAMLALMRSGRKRKAE